MITTRGRAVVDRSAGRVPARVCGVGELASLSPEPLPPARSPLVLELHSRARGRTRPEARERRDEMEYRLSARAAIKMLLHSCKDGGGGWKGQWSWGVLLGRRRGAEAEIADGVPAFRGTTLSPMTEYAWSLVEAYATECELQIVGIYVANAFDGPGEDRPGEAAKLTARAAARRAGRPMALVHVVRKRMSVPDTESYPPFHVYGPVTPESKTVPERGAALTLRHWPDTRRRLVDLLRADAHRDELVDIQDHIDDLQRDWRNISINALVREPEKEDNTGRSAARSAGTKRDASKQDDQSGVDITDVD